MPARQRTVWVPEHLRVVVRMQVDETRGDDHAVGVEHLVGVGGIDASEPSDTATRDRDIAATAWHACAVDDHAASDQCVVASHVDSSSPRRARVQMV